MGKLTNIRIASPCSADWDRMAGDHQVRFCPQCNLNVYNFSGMLPAEVTQIVAQREGRVCARFYQRKDGTVLTENCPVGIRGTVLRVSRFASATLAAVLSAGPAIAARSTQQASFQMQPTLPALSVEIVDPSGAVISKAQIGVANEQAGKLFSFISDEAGRLSLSCLPSGTYEITVVAQFFKTLKLAHFAVPAKGPVRIQLELGAVMGEVVVVSTPREGSPLSRHLSPPPVRNAGASATSANAANFRRRFLSGLRKFLRFFPSSSAN